MLTEKQQKIYEWLDDKLKLPVYAEAYKGAVDMLNGKYPGYITFVSHTGRDIMNQLARIVSGISTSQVDNKKLIGNLADKWKDEWRGQELSLTQSHGDGYTIPYNVCNMVTDLIEQNRDGTIRNKGADDLFFDTFLGYSERNRIPSIKKWRKAKKFFVKRAHLREGNFSEKESHELEENFQTLEEFLYIAATRQYSRIRSLDAILEKANK